jgi:hypothetical protein
MHGFTKYTSVLMLDQFQKDGLTIYPDQVGLESQPIYTLFGIEANDAAGDDKIEKSSVTEDPCPEALRRI